MITEGIQITARKGGIMKKYSFVMATPACAFAFLAKGDFIFER
jgi:hypothetical protein